MFALCKLYWFKLFFGLKWCRVLKVLVFSCNGTTMYFRKSQDAKTFFSLLTAHYNENLVKRSTCVVSQKTECSISSFLDYTILNCLLLVISFHGNLEENTSQNIFVPLCHWLYKYLSSGFRYKISIQYHKWTLVQMIKIRYWQLIINSVFWPE